MTDVNPQALRFVRIYAAAAAVSVEDIGTSGLEKVRDPIDIVMMNPPYILDDAQRTYRHGRGDAWRAAFDRSGNCRNGKALARQAASLICRKRDCGRRRLCEAHSSRDHREPWVLTQISGSIRIFSARNWIIRNMLTSTGSRRSGRSPPRCHDRAFTRAPRDIARNNEHRSAAG